MFQCIHDRLNPWPYHSTLTGHFLQALSTLSPQILADNNFRTCKSVTLMNGDTCPIGQWVLIGGQDQPAVAQVQEIIQRNGSEAESASQPDAIFLKAGTLQGNAKPYGMPSAKAEDSWLLYPVQVGIP
jgi:hypothetical protein